MLDLIFAILAFPFLAVFTITGLVGTYAFILAIIKGIKLAFREDEYKNMPKS